MKKILLLLFFAISSLFIKAEENKILKITLDYALKSGSNYCGLELSVPVRNGVWPKEVLGYSVFYSEFGQYTNYPKSFNKMDHWGKISEINSGTSFTSFYVNMIIKDDPWIEGGRGNYNINININGDSCNGTFTGTFQDSISVSGNVFGVIKNNPMVELPDYNILSPGEHPRLIFRKDELAEIRDMAQNTPEGQAIMKRLQTTLETPFDYMTRTCAWMAAGHGVMYSLTEDKFWSDSTRVIVTNIMNSTTDNSKMIRRAPRYMGVAIAYDFCYDAWEEDYPEYREKVANWLEKRMLEIVKGGGLGYNSHPMSNWMGIAYGSLGTIAMAVLGDSARFVYEEPHRPVNDIINSENLTAGEGITVIDLLNDSLSDHWVFAGPIMKTDDNDDILESAGGSSSANPDSNTSFVYNGNTYNFKKLKPKDFWNGGKYTNNQLYIDVVNNINHNYYHSALYYTVLECKSERKVRLNMNFFSNEDIKGKIWLNGTEIRNGDYIHLKPGKYRLLAEVTIDICESWGHIAFRPIFTDVSQSEIDEIYPLLMADYNSEYSIWKEKYDNYLNNGGKIASAEFHLNLAEAGMKRWLEMGMGSNGFYSEGEGYLRFSITCGVGQFIHAYRKVMGKDISKYYGFDNVLSKIISENINENMWAWGPAGWSGFGMQEERSGCFNMLLSSCNDKQIPAIKYIYDNVYGLSGNNTFNIEMPHQAAYALENYPFSTIAKAPAQELGKFMLDEQKGYIIARKSYNMSDDFLTTFYVKEEYKTATHQANDYPEIRIQGLGKQIGQIYHLNVSNEINGHQGGKIITLKKDNEGSFIMNANMDNIYLSKYDKTSYSYPSQGINAHRSLAVDYSEKSGYPALYAIVDRISGAGSENWQMNAPDAQSGSVSGQNFQINYSDFSIYGKVLSPATATLNYADGLLSVTGGNDFYIVFCASSSTTPSFTVSGSGMNSSATIGSQSISYNFTDSILEFTDFNNAPIIEIVSPLTNDEYTTKDSVLVDANISDSDGTIALIKYMVNDSLIYTTNSPADKPEIVFENAGSFKINIIAYDNENDSTISKYRYIKIVNKDITTIAYNLTASEYFNEFIELQWNDILTNEEAYIIERRSGTSKFKEIGRTSANSSSFIDISTEKGISYTYRIKAFNRTDQFYYSTEESCIINETTSIFTESIVFNTSIYPNPHKDYLNIDINSKNTSPLNIRIINNSGQIIYNKIISELSEGKNEITITNIPEYNGISLLVIIRNNK
ncbi:MAG: Ig-like domain-containing protein, partial [bacterium]